MATESSRKRRRYGGRRASRAAVGGDDRTIEVELRRGGIAVKLNWPMSASMGLSV